MNRFFLLILAIFFFSCSANRINRYYTKASVETFYYTNGSKAAMGKVLVNAESFWFKNSTHNCGYFEPYDCEDWERVPRTGKWKFWYPNGNLKAEINFDAHKGFFCSIGPEYDYYDEKIGEYHIWHKNGLVLSKGKFTTIVKNVGNSCEGGQDLRIGKVLETFPFFSNKGQIINNIQTLDSLRLMVEQL